MPLFCLSVYIQDVALMESMQLGLETVVSAIFDSSAVFVACSSETKFQLQRILEGRLINSVLLLLFVNALS